jgi:hypothetical protein
MTRSSRWLLQHIFVLIYLQNIAKLYYKEKSTSVVSNFELINETNL